MLDIIKVKSTVQCLLDYLQEDFNSNPIENQTWMYTLLTNKCDGNYNFYDQAKEIFLRDCSSPRKISVRLEMPKDISNLPCIVVREPSRIKGAGNTIGKTTADYVEVDSQDQRRVLIDHKKASFELMCVSSNVLESILISEILYALLMAHFDVFSDSYTGVEINMKELIAETNLIPTPILFRSVLLNLDTYNFIPKLSAELVIKSIEANNAIPI